MTSRVDYIKSLRIGYPIMFVAKLNKSCPKCANDSMSIILLDVGDPATREKRLMRKTDCVRYMVCDNQECGYSNRILGIATL